MEPNDGNHIVLCMLHILYNIYILTNIHDIGIIYIWILIERRSKQAKLLRHNILPQACVSSDRFHYLMISSELLTTPLKFPHTPTPCMYLQQAPTRLSTTPLNGTTPHYPLFRASSDNPRQSWLSQYLGSPTRFPQPPIMYSDKLPQSPTTVLRQAPTRVMQHSDVGSGVIHERSIYI